ncbi:MAG TPA: hypothetical protein VMV69_01560 [Pirellulales bacterium]|nr:hypothetical protein [Pirellulales bacterium]
MPPREYVPDLRRFVRPTKPAGQARAARALAGKQACLAVWPGKRSGQGHAAGGGRAASR